MRNREKEKIDENLRPLRLARQEAKRRSRAGKIKYTKALDVVAVEQGFASWLDMLKAHTPDFVVHLTPIGKSEVEVEVQVYLRSVLEFSGIDQHEWDALRADEHEELVIEYALGTRQQRADFTRYYAEIVEGFNPDADVPAAPTRDA